MQGGVRDGPGSALWGSAMAKEEWTQSDAREFPPGHEKKLPRAEL